MKWSTAATIGLFVVSSGLFAYSVMITNNNLDVSGPEISMKEDSVTISIKDGEEAILSGITAVDSRDGDVTDSLVVESLSNFVETGVRMANIVAFDKDNHISRMTREVVYSDYTAPRYTLEEPLRFNMDSYDFISCLAATDCLDGEISNKIHMTYDEEYNYGQEEIKVTYSVSNSEGDVANLPVTLSLYNTAEEGYRPQIQLTDYLIYVGPEDKVDPMKYLSSVTVSGKQYKNRDGKMVRTGSSSSVNGPEYLNSDLLDIENPLEAKPGTYEICYTVVDPRDEEDSTDDTRKTIRLIVVRTEE